jgi:hypothetical protein
MTVTSIIPPYVTVVVIAFNAHQIDASVHHVAHRRRGIGETSVSAANALVAMEGMLSPPTQRLLVTG